MGAQNDESHAGDSTSKEYQFTEDQQDHVDAKQSDDKIKPEYATAWRLAIIMCTLNLSTLIAALDIGIVATAIPRITQDFNSLNDIGWYSSTCFLLVGTTSAMWGKTYKYFPATRVYMLSLTLYLIGSVVAATAPGSIALIVGRAIQGWGCSGTFSGSLLLINYTAAPARRPMLIGIWMGIFMTSTVVGPLIGGVFTTEVTWRWCFWINLPIGGAAIILQLLFLRTPRHIEPAPASWKEKVLQLDLPGFTLLLTSLICFTLALQWGGLTKPWSNGSVIATLVIFVALTVTFFVAEWLQTHYAAMPLSLMKSRVTWSYCLYAFLAAAANFHALFYLPIYFQSIKGMTAIESGVHGLPFVAFYALGCVISGAVVGQTRLLQPVVLTSSLLVVLGAGLLIHLDVDSAKAWYIGAQIPFGLGSGLGNQVPVTALQAFATPETVATITGVVLTCQTISGSYFLTAAQSIFENRMLETLARIAPNIDTARVLSAGASGIQQTFSGAELGSVLAAYMVGIKDVFAFTLACAACTVLLSMLVPFERLPGAGSEEEDVKEAVA